jgi:transposase-like protein
MRNRVERFFRHLKERTAVFHHKMSARDHIQGINNLKPFLNLSTIYYQASTLLLRTKTTRDQGNNIHTNKTTGP